MKELWISDAVREVCQGGFAPERRVITGRVVRWARRMTPERLAELREEYRRPGPGYRELFVDGVASGWMPPTWEMPAHRCIMLRVLRGYERAFVESVDEREVRCRRWTDADDAAYAESRALAATR